MIEMDLVYAGYRQDLERELQRLRDAGWEIIGGNYDWEHSVAEEHGAPVYWPPPYIVVTIAAENPAESPDREQWLVTSWSKNWDRNDP